MTTTNSTRWALSSLLAALLSAGCAVDGAPSDEGDEAVSTLDAELAAQLVWPISGTVTQNSAPAPGHPGIDIGAGVGTPIFAAASGDVVTPYYDPGGYGCNVVINHSGGGGLGAGTISVYGHMSQTLVTAGTHVEQGALLGYSGGAAGAPCSGNSSGPHLHFEIRTDGIPVRGWDASVGVGQIVTALEGISTHVDGIPEGGSCEEACANFGCHCVDGQCSGGFCPGSGCTQQETDDCAAFGVNCVDHQCNGGFGPGTGCTARETIDCGNFGANCVDHQCSGGFGAGSGCTGAEIVACGNYGVNCVDHQCSGGFGEGSGCTAGEALACSQFGCGCADHACGGGFCEGTGCTAHQAIVCEQQGKSCNAGTCY
ncbi:MAG: M23 family metallopeptidase [Polyangiaceae bacterium]